jgi:hypothetical protein
VTPFVLTAAQSAEVVVERVSGDLPRPSYVDRLDVAGGEEFVEFGAADAECGGGFGDGVDELGGLLPGGGVGGDRDRLLSVGW